MRPSRPAALLALIVATSAAASEGGGAVRRVEVPLTETGGLATSDVVDRLARAGGLEMPRPASGLVLPTRGLAGPLTRTLLAECLGPGVEVELGPRAAVLTVDEAVLDLAHSDDWRRRLDELTRRAEEAQRRRDGYGMRARPSYRPGNPSRPTVCLVHGMNSSSGGFVHMVPWLEEAGYGVILHDYPFNQPIAASCDQFRRDWSTFRAAAGETQPWAIVAHSMGALVARSLVETPDGPGGEVASLILIAPVNGGAHIARVQTVLQLVSGLSAVQGAEKSRALAQLSDGIGQAAGDMLPSSPFLRRLNGRQRNPRVPYHILAGDVGFLTREGRRQIEGRVELLTRNAGLLGPFARLATAEVTPLLEELTDGTGDGCVSVQRTKLNGVSDHVTIHANHAELIRAPLLYPDPGPVVSMPWILRWLAADFHRPR